MKCFWRFFFRDELILLKILFAEIEEYQSFSD